MLRSAWLSQELLTTFSEELDSVTLIPSPPDAPGGTFVVRWNDDKVVWDRKQEGSFPESKELKQRIRNLVAPEKFLGHSDTKERQEQDCVDCERESTLETKATTEDTTTTEREQLVYPNIPSPNVGITYCTGCRWLLRAAWIAQELLTTFDDTTELASVTLIPSRPPAKGGIFVSLFVERIKHDKEMSGLTHLTFPHLDGYFGRRAAVG